MTSTTKRIIASVISLAAFAVIGVILYIYVPIDSSPSTLASTGTKPDVQVGGLQKMHKPSALSNATSYVAELATNATASISNVSNTIKESLPLPSLRPEDNRTLTMNVIVTGGSLTVLAIIALIAYKIHKIRALRRHRMAYSHGILGFFSFVVSAIFKQLSGVIMVPQVSLTIGAIGFLYLIIWLKFGLSRFSSHLLISIMSGIGISASTYFIFKQLGLSTLSAIMGLISDINIDDGVSLTGRIAGNIATAPFLIILPLLFFIGATSYANYLIPYGAPSDSLTSFLGLITTLLSSCIYAVLFVAIGTLALIFNVNFISKRAAIPSP